MEPSQSPQKPPQEPVEIEGEKRASVGKPAGCHTTGSLRTDAEVEQLQRRHLSEQQQLQLEQLDQLKAFKEQLLRDLFTQLSPQQRPRPPPIQSFPPSLLSLPNIPQLHLSATHLCGDFPPSVPGNPSSTPGGRGDITPPPLPPVLTLNRTPAPSPVSRHTPDKTPTRQFPSVHSLPPTSPHRFSPSCEAAKTSPPHSLPNSPTPPSWSLANSLETPVPRCSEQNPTQQLHFSPYSPQGPVRDEHQPNSSQETRSFNQTQFPVCPVPRRAWVNGGVATPPNHTRSELFQKHARQFEDLKSYYNSQMVQQLQSANDQHENNATPMQPLIMIPSSEDPVYVDAAVGRRSLAVHSHPSPPSPVPPGVASPQTQLQKGAFARLAADNEQLMAKCADMESTLHQCNMYVPYSSKLFV